MTEDKDMFDKLQQEQRDLDASYRQSVQNKKEHEARDQDQATGNKGVTVCKSKTCTNSLYKWTSSRDPRYCADCL